jgi:WD40 repeat protein
MELHDLTGRKIGVFATGHRSSTKVLAYSPDGRYLLAGDDGTVKLWDLQRGLLDALTGHTASVSSVAWSPDGRYLATGSADRTIHVWTAGSCEARVIEDAGKVGSLQFSPNGQLLVSANDRGAVCIRDLSGRLVSSYHLSNLDKASAQSASASPTLLRILSPVKSVQNKGQAGHYYLSISAAAVRENTRTARSRPWRSAG